MVEIDVNFLSWVLPLVIGTAVPFVIVILNRMTSRKDSSIEAKVKLEEVSIKTNTLTTMVKEKFDKLDSELNLREDVYRKESIDIKTRLEFITGKLQLFEYRLDKINGVGGKQ